MSTEELEGKLNAANTVLLHLIDLLSIDQANRLADELKHDILHEEVWYSTPVSPAAKKAYLNELGIYKKNADDVAKGK